jgi:putative membrane protein
VTRLLAFRWHPVELAVIVVAWGAHRLVVTDRRRRRQVLGALVALAAAVLWPLGDLAARVSLTAATLQRLILMLLVAPQLLLATPTSVLARLTRPAPIDAVVRRLAHPGVAIAVVTIAGTATLAVPVVDWGARSVLGRAVVVVATLLVGLELWVPALSVVPGTRRLSAVARAGYLFASSLVVTSLSFVWIFARHPMYPALYGQHAILHLTPLADQQLAGFVAKLGAYAPMWAVAFTIVARAESRGAASDSPLHWADVERHLERADRQRAREARRREPGSTPSA